MKTIVSFTSTRHPIPEYETPVTPGRELVEELATGLAREGISMESLAPVEGEGGWSVWLSVLGVSFSVFLNEAGLGTPKKLHWVLGFSKSGIFRWVRSSKRKAASEKLYSAIDRVLREEMGCSDVRWWDYPEFEKALRGQIRDV